MPWRRSSSLEMRDLSRGFIACHILIDGRRRHIDRRGVGKVEIPLPPGRHEVTVRAGFVGSQPVGIEAGPGEVYHLKVANNMAFWRRERLLVFILVILAPLAIQFINIACGRLFSDRIEMGWLNRFMIPMVTLPSLVLFAFMGVWRDHLLALEEVPPLDPAAGRVMLPEVPPLRLRITIRGMMIAVAVLAIILGGGIEWRGHERRVISGERRAAMRQLEAQYRAFERDWVRMAADGPSGLDTSSVRQVPGQDHREGRLLRRDEAQVRGGRRPGDFLRRARPARAALALNDARPHGSEDSGRDAATVDRFEDSR